MATRVSSGGDDHDAAGLERVKCFRPPGDICASRRRAGVNGLQSAIDDASDACDSASSTSPTICRMAKAMGIALVHESRWN
jgi:hypothetical protein